MTPTRIDTMKISGKWAERFTLFLVVLAVFVAGMTTELLRTKGWVEDTVHENTDMVVFMGAQYNLLIITAELCRIDNDVKQCARMMESHAVIVRNFILHGFKLDSLPPLENDDERPPQKVFARRTVRSSS